MGKYFKYGIHTIQSENQIPKELIEDKYTFYVKINGKDIEDYYFDYLDIMQNAFLLHTKDCIGNPMAFKDWMTDLSWLVYDTEEPLEDDFYGYKNILLVFEHWNDVGKGWFSSGQKLRDKILGDFRGNYVNEYGMNVGSLFKEYDEDYGDLENDGLDIFNIYLIP